MNFDAKGFIQELEKINHLQVELKDRLRSVELKQDRYCKDLERMIMQNGILHAEIRSGTNVIDLQGELFILEWDDEDGVIFLEPVNVIDIEAYQEYRHDAIAI